MNMQGAKFYPIDRYGALFDAHIHTYFDYHDGQISPQGLIQATLKRKFNWVLAMAHDTVRGNIKIRNLAREAGLPTITGIEISTPFNHILAFGIKEWPYRRRTIDPEYAIDILRKQDCAIFLSHPYAGPSGSKGNWSPEIIKRLDIDGIEWHNATTYFKNKDTYQHLKAFMKGRRIAGTDAHHVAAFGWAFTQVDVNSSDPDDLVTAMQHGKCTPYCGSVPISHMGVMMFQAIRQHSLVKRKYIEHRWIKPNGDHPKSIRHPAYTGPEVRDGNKKRDQYISKWQKEFLKQPLIPRTVGFF